MKASFLLVLALCGGLSAPARAETPVATYSPQQLAQLVGPIALYPDPLVALILPAATVPTDITLAAGYLAANGDPEGIDTQPCDPSVKALARYPDVVIWMNENPAWTQALGAAFLQQSGDIMASIQQLRARALAAGTLLDTPQQLVDVDGDNVRIVPAEPARIYVPVYNPEFVYETPVGVYAPFITFGPGCAVGPWLGYQCDWDNLALCVGPWSRGWAHIREWRHLGRERDRWHFWHCDPRRAAEFARHVHRASDRVPRPGFIAITRPSPDRHVAVAYPTVAGATSAVAFHHPASFLPQPSSPAPFVPRGAANPSLGGGRGLGAFRASGRAPAVQYFRGTSSGIPLRSFNGGSQVSGASSMRTFMAQPASVRVPSPVVVPSFVPAPVQVHPPAPIQAFVPAPIRAPAPAPVHVNAPAPARVPPPAQAQVVYRERR